MGTSNSKQSAEKVGNVISWSARGVNGGYKVSRYDKYISSTNSNGEHIPDDDIEIENIVRRGHYNSSEMRDLIPRMLARQDGQMMENRELNGRISELESHRTVSLSTIGALVVLLGLAAFGLYKVKLCIKLYLL